MHTMTRESMILDFLNSSGLRYERTEQIAEFLREPSTVVLLCLRSLRRRGLVESVGTETAWVVVR